MQIGDINEVLKTQIVSIWCFR